MIDIDQDAGIVHGNQMRWMFLKHCTRTLITVTLAQIAQAACRKPDRMAALTPISRRRCCMTGAQRLSDRIDRGRFDVRHITQCDQPRKRIRAGKNAASERSTHAIARSLADHQLGSFPPEQIVQWRLIRMIARPNNGKDVLDGRGQVARGSDHDRQSCMLACGRRLHQFQAFAGRVVARAQPRGEEHSDWPLHGRYRLRVTRNKAHTIKPASITYSAMLTACFDCA